MDVSSGPCRICSRCSFVLLIYVPVASEVACCEIAVLVRSVHVFGKFENQLLTCLKFVRIVLLLYACVCVFM